MNGQFTQLYSQNILGFIETLCWFLPIDHSDSESKEEMRQYEDPTLLEIAESGI